ncbi:OsmC family protein [uncultured Cytophaga sp.]|uniref:OsmC family protein n=1 Tax=uncultured Cytophaga sp. TaxID=160238 RepID=UPI00261CFD4B|nr:OsmC family protein [uncultured Cytophaga sp.]
MEIELNLLNNAYHFEAKNEQGNSISIDASPAIGGENKGPRPMELLIMGLGGCSGIDVLSILRKQKIEPEGFRIKLHADREKDAVPSLFTEILVEFIFKGNIDPIKAERAVKLSMDKYCSVAKTLEKTATITYKITME